MKTKWIKTFSVLNMLIVFSTSIAIAWGTKFKVMSISMKPALNIGDDIEIEPVKDFKNLRGSIIAYYPPVEEGKLYIHRCIAVEGDSFAIKHGRVYLNNRELVEPYTIGETTYEYYNTEKIKIEGMVPAGMVIVLGDNRNNAADSRCFGYIPFNRIYGIVRKI